MTPRICVSILPKNNLEALTLIEQAEKTQAELIEVRMDYFESSRNLIELAKSTQIPLIATNKLVKEHGFFAGDESERQQTLLNAAKAGFQYVDVDLSSPLHQETIDKLKKLGAKTIVSYHQFDGPLTSCEMEAVLEKEKSCCTNVCKIIGTAKKMDDNLATLNFIASNSKVVNLVCFCMGDHGKVSRLMSPLFGAFFTFASLESSSQTADGQMTVEEMRVAYKLLGAK